MRDAGGRVTTHRGGAFARTRYGRGMSEIAFIVEEDPDGGFTARAVGQGIFTEADDLVLLREAVRDAVRCHSPSEADRPRVIRLHRVHEDVFAA